MREAVVGTIMYKQQKSTTGSFLSSYLGFTVIITSLFSDAKRDSFAGACCKLPLRERHAGRLAHSGRKLFGAKQVSTLHSNA